MKPKVLFPQIMGAHNDVAAGGFDCNHCYSAGVGTALASCFRFQLVKTLKIKEKSPHSLSVISTLMSEL